jgi:hypothetical protein
MTTLFTGNTIGRFSVSIRAISAKNKVPQITLIFADGHIE